MDNCETLLKDIYDICSALISIVDFECCAYGFDNEIKMAECYIKAYEEEHTDGKKA